MAASMEAMKVVHAGAGDGVALRGIEAEIPRAREDRLVEGNPEINKDAEMTSQKDSGGDDSLRIIEAEVASAADGKLVDTDEMQSPKAGAGDQLRVQEAEAAVISTAADALGDNSQITPDDKAGDGVVPLSINEAAVAMIPRAAADATEDKDNPQHSTRKMSSQNAGAGDQPSIKEAEFSMLPRAAVDATEDNPQHNISSHNAVAGEQLRINEAEGSKVSPASAVNPLREPEATSGKNTGQQPPAPVAAETAAARYAHYADLNERMLRGARRMAETSMPWELPLCGGAGYANTPAAGPKPLPPPEPSNVADTSLMPPPAWVRNTPRAGGNAESSTHDPDTGASDSDDNLVQIFPKGKSVAARGSAGETVKDASMSAPISSFSPPAAPMSKYRARHAKKMAEQELLKSKRALTRKVIAQPALVTTSTPVPFRSPRVATMTMNRYRARKARKIAAQELLNAKHKVDAMQKLANAPTEAAGATNKQAAGMDHLTFRETLTLLGTPWVPLPDLEPKQFPFPATANAQPLVPSTSVPTKRPGDELTQLVAKIAKVVENCAKLLGPVDVDESDSDGDDTLVHHTGEAPQPVSAPIPAISPPVAALARSRAGGEDGIEKREMLRARAAAERQAAAAERQAAAAERQAAAARKLRAEAQASTSIDAETDPEEYILMLPARIVQEGREAPGNLMMTPAKVLKSSLEEEDSDIESDSDDEDALVQLVFRRHSRKASDDD
ncbi:hypothetical protein FN846DRAFT_1023443 [Sphaerosporella brunnea]|uniref:Uncharacterized protein n=1 Tax=Sphaerosporella brunnea TaxID=1250544 RepID=A0A5J5EPH3_9PEZI|nr:hypothetical protein FN846DRAFT_1023443 [Sphaerosporella brunnea]